MRLRSGRASEPRHVALRRELLKTGLLSLAGGAAVLRYHEAAACTTTPSSVVRTTNGALKGTACDGISAFRGIRYGAPTGDENRFMPPQPPASWQGVQDASQLGPQCPQFNPNLALWLDPAPSTEDCLCLNVWTPDPSGKNPRLPVMVWIHGGAFTRGSGGGVMYDGHQVAKSGNVVFVTVNHRLNAFGYLYLPDGGAAAAANVGQLDLVAALQWVRANIEHFGGDPGNVTIFGQSGGGAKISALMAMPAARSLYHKAIIESGSVLTTREPGAALDVTDRVCSQLGLTRRDIGALKRVSTAQLLASTKDLPMVEVGPSGGSGFVFGPVVDGAVLPRQPWQPSAPESAPRIPMIIGSTADETAALLGAAMYESIPDDDALLDRVRRNAILSDRPEADLPRLLTLYRQEAPHASRTELLVRMSTDLGFWRNAVRQAALKVQAGGAPVFLYEFAWKTPCFGSSWALHSVELPFVFGLREYGGSLWDGADSDATRAAADPHNDHYRLTDLMVATWTRFARTGDPSSGSLRWPAYDLTTRPVMIFDRQSRVTNGLQSKARESLLAE